MKVSFPLVAGLALAIFSLAISSDAPANAGPLMTRCWMSSNTSAVTVPSTGGACPKIANSYAECVKMASDRGWDHVATFFACTTQRYKS